MRKALVTGGSRGIGFAIAKILAENNCTVVITGRNEKAIKEAAEKIGKSAIPMVWNSRNYDKCDDMIATASELLGGLDAVVNNAGIFAQRSEWEKNELLKTTPEEWKSVIDVNTSALFFMMQAAVNYFLKNKIKGNILNITSVAGEEPVFGAYGASKTASTALTRGWGKMFASDGITINAIAPGPVATEMNNWHEGDSMEHDRVPYGRFSTAEEIAKLALYLLSDTAKMICGETVIIDGGYSIR